MTLKCPRDLDVLRMTEGELLIVVIQGVLIQTGCVRIDLLREPLAQRAQRVVRDDFAFGCRQVRPETFRHSRMHAPEVK